MDLASLLHVYDLGANIIEAKFESYSNSTTKDNVEVKINDKLEVT